MCSLCDLSSSMHLLHAFSVCWLSLHPQPPGIGWKSFIFCRLLTPIIALKCTEELVWTAFLCRKVSALSVTQLVTPEDLLDSLALESSGISSRLQQLLLPSYFPNLEEGPSLVAYLLRQCPEAGKAFCRCLAGGLPGTGLPF